MNRSKSVNNPVVRMFIHPFTHSGQAMIRLVTRSVGQLIV